MRLVGPDELEASRHAERLTADLRAALGWAVAQHLNDVIDAIAALAVVTGTRGSFEMGGWCYDLRDDLPERPAVQEAALAYAVNSKADLAEARCLCHRLLELTNDTSASAWMQLGIVEFNEGHFDQAVDHLRRAYAIGEDQPDDRFLHVVAPTILACILAATARDAGELIAQVFDHARAMNWPTGLANAHCTRPDSRSSTPIRRPPFTSSVVRSRSPSRSATDGPKDLPGQS